MIVSCVFISVKPAYLENFMKATKLNHENSLLEPGNLRFDILQQAEDKCKFTFYEAYIDENAMSAHKNTMHYLKWKEAVEPFMAATRKAILHCVIYPDELSKW